ncbi:ATP-dependent helicase, partial [Bacillus thuringiensis]|nr:ATP-dependent helicase [Bacillus thuringiensis]
PNTNEIPVKIPVTKMYNEFKKHHIIEIGEELLIGDTPAAKKLYLRQLAGSYNEHKLQYIKDLIESTNDRIIIF